MLELELAMWIVVACASGWARLCVELHLRHYLGVKAILAHLGKRSDVSDLIL